MSALTNPSSRNWAENFARAGCTRNSATLSCTLEVVRHRPYLLILFVQMACLRAEVDQLKLEKTLKVIDGKWGQGRG